VYSPTKGMTTGGHLLIYDALHLTEMSRTYDTSIDEDGVVRGNYATNETHVVDRQVIRMMLALPDLVLVRGDIVFMSYIHSNNHLITRKN
jgi:hypothetical protein